MGVRCLRLLLERKGRRGVGVEVVPDHVLHVTSFVERTIGKALELLPFLVLDAARSRAQDESTETKQASFSH